MLATVERSPTLIPTTPTHTPLQVVERAVAHANNVDFLSPSLYVLVFTRFQRGSMSDLGAPRVLDDHQLPMQLGIHEKYGRCVADRCYITKTF